MKFILKNVSKCSGRLGNISNIERVPNFNAQTPFLMLHSKGGSVPHLSKEVLDYLSNDTHCLEICVSNTEHMEKAVSEHGKGITNFVGLKDFVSFLTVKDPSELCPSGYHEKDSLPIFTKYGKTNITPERYMRIVEAFKPDVYHVLCDGDTNKDSSKRRIMKSLDRSEEFLKICIDIHKNSEHLKNSVLLGAVEGGFDIKSREKSIESLLQFNEIGGFLIDGFHSNGPDVLKIDEPTLIETVKHVSTLLPPEKLRFMLGPYNPITLLELVKIGVDVFDSSFPYVKAMQNRALTFSIDVSDADLHNRTFDIDLSKTEYSEEFKPFVENCVCLACRKHTRAYSYHLYNTKEMLGPILLMLHNLHHYIEFFKVIQTHVANDSLDDLIRHISKQSTIPNDDTDENLQLVIE